ncbi:unnamed protein product [Lepeophtheirus salmonis]|uniref:(salmon louse) hypothetical protein n=1 Tax=Lepeophtheirus salmonis TaxID=72036 RepID=A0A7R8CRY3_LEPSM|nr:unnamed protein product [Lepeophtheirus salmonis]CAF2874787.1 unnamed protein product [Lepeophtheirus salmonis]
MELHLKVKCKKYFVAVDIKKMFFSINLADPHDKNMFRFVWGRPRDQPSCNRIKNLEVKKVQEENYSGKHIEWKCSAPEVPLTNDVTERMEGTVENDPVQESSEGGTINTNPGEEALTATSKSVLFPIQHLQDAEEHTSCMTTNGIFFLSI